MDKYIPSELIMIILSKLPVQSILSFKCVCKSWLDLIESDEFVKLQLSESVPCLTVGPILSSKSYKFFEFNDDLDLEHHKFHYKLVTKFRFPHYSLLHSSVNGLLFLHGQTFEGGALYVCNPITRDYIKLHYPKEFAFPYVKAVSYGFGASKMSGKHKVVRIFHAYVYDDSAYDNVRAFKLDCHVYTLGTGSWRRIEPGDLLDYGNQNTGPFLNGNLHWLVCEVDGTRLVSCFDLETEVFSTFPSPFVPDFGRKDGQLCVLGDCLCFCEIRTGEGMIIWLVKEYGVEKCWTKEFFISFFNTDLCKPCYPTKVFRDGDILMAPFLFCYSATKSKHTHELDILKDGMGKTVIYTPTFLSLKTFGNETVRSF